MPSTVAEVFDGLLTGSAEAIQRARTLSVFLSEAANSAARGNFNGVRHWQRVAERETEQ
jgi:hypothetical protein